MWVPLGIFLGFPGGSAVKNSPAMQETLVQSLGWEDPLEKGKATYFSILAWRISWTDGLYSSWGCNESGTTEQLSYTSAQAALDTCKPLLAGKEPVSLSFMGGPEKKSSDRPVLKRETIKSWTFVSDPAPKYQSDYFLLPLRRLREEIETNSAMLIKVSLMETREKARRNFYYRGKKLPDIWRAKGLDENV